MKKETSAFLQTLDLYPREVRESHTLDELLSHVSAFKISLEEARKIEEERYENEGIWDDSASTILREAINYLTAGIKYKNKAFQMNYGKTKFGPMY